MRPKHKNRYEWGRTLKRAGFKQVDLMYPMNKTMSCFTMGPWEFLMKTKVGTIEFVISRRNSKCAFLQFFTMTHPFWSGNGLKDAGRHNRKVEPRIKITVAAIADPSLAPELAGLEWATQLMEELLKPTRI